MATDRNPQRALSSPDGKPHLFVTMDGLRGVAALAVIAFHGRVLVRPLAFPSGYLAVDFFFMLSGFVLTYAYGARLDAGWSTWEYCKTRLVRLYPLYLLGLALGVAYVVAIHLFRHLPPLGGHLLPTLGLGLLLLPVLSTHPFSNTAAFPLNYPSWSILFELLVNIGQALFLRRRSSRFLLGVAAVSLLGMLGYTRMTGTINLGLDSPENLLCLFRVLFSYTLGMLLFRAWRTGRFRVKVPPAVIGALLLGTFALPLTRHVVLWEVLIVALEFPLVILLAATVEPGPRWRTPFRLLGLVSYAIYILHGPLMSMWEELWPHVRHHTLEHDAPWDGLLLVLLLLGFALVVDRVYDLPARAWLRQRLLRRRAAG